MPNRKQIVLINPPVVEIPKSQIFVTTIPLGMAYIAAYLNKNGFKVILIDALGLAIEKRSDWKNLKLRGLAFKEIIERIPRESEIICISANFTSQHPLYTGLVSKLRKTFPEKKIV